MPSSGTSKRPLGVLAGWDPATKDAQVETECDNLTGGYNRVSCASTERAWIGLRGRPGIRSGAYCFEVKVTEGLLRVGWATSTASLSLGTDDQGFGYGGTGKKSHRNNFTDYGTAFAAGDVVTCCLDRVHREVSFGVNGQHFGRAFAVPRAWDGVALFPALCAREAFRATGYFGCPNHPKVPHGCGYWPLGDAYASDVVESDAGPPASLQLPAVLEPLEKKQDRAERFSKMARVDLDLQKVASYIPSAMDSASSSGALVGRSRALERGYLRDASKLRDPAHIRPVPVLREALAHVVNARRPWAWEAEMLRAIRQDLTVQHADSDFLEEVCEVSALRALRNSDWITFVACVPGVGRRRCGAELSWLALLGSSPVSSACALKSLPEADGSTACFVRSILSDMYIGNWTRVLKRHPPTDTAAQAHAIVIRPLALANVLVVATKAFHKLRIEPLHRLGLQELPGYIRFADGTLVDAQDAHARAQLQSAAACRPTQRDDHGDEFLRL